MTPEHAPAHPRSSSTRLASRWAQLDTSTRALVIVLVIGGLAIGALGFLGYPLFLPYGWHLALHILGAVIFLGNIIVTALWMTFLVQSRDARLIHRAGQATMWADVAFTAPGVFLLFGNGAVMLEAIGGAAAHPWAAVSFVLFAITGVVWLALLVPAQNTMVRLARGHMEAGTPLGPAFDRTFLRWAVVGGLATVLLLVVLVLMVLKPAL